MQVTKFIQTHQLISYFSVFLIALQAAKFLLEILKQQRADLNAFYSEQKSLLKDLSFLEYPRLTVCLVLADYSFPFLSQWLQM